MSIYQSDLDTWKNYYPGVYEAGIQKCNKDNIDTCCVQTCTDVCKPKGSVGPGPCARGWVDNCKLECPDYLHHYFYPPYVCGSNNCMKPNVCDNNECITPKQSQLRALNKMTNLSKNQKIGIVVGIVIFLLLLIIIITRLMKR